MFLNFFFKGKHREYYWQSNGSLSERVTINECKHTAHFINEDQGVQFFFLE